ncbi:hypothetical protein PSAN_52490 [Pseudomonas antarctica]|uniref:HicB-like antitoxin of toxin-antitoxin system domain-containing protein n=1 Tax=Pseudomonas antarctica TaxID=219572 RepID=A0ABQ6ZNQ9_9PSED|nr:hypothetical protein PSAN_52490 [Pseudomonas antarctica]
MLQEIAAEGGASPMPTSVANHHAHEEYAGMGRGMLALGISPYLGKTEKVNVTLPGYVIQRIDRYVREHKVKSRSSFLADAALQKWVRS